MRHHRGLATLMMADHPPLASVGRAVSRPRASLRAVALLLGCAGVGLAAEPPVAVSPGSPSGSRVEGRCPTFSWSAVPGASSYELVLYRVDEGGVARQEAEPILRQTFPGSVTSWTPSLDGCLERGGGYAWSVGALATAPEPEWSDPSLFEVAAVPSEAELEQALEVVRQYLGPAGAATDASVQDEAPARLETRAAASPPPSPAASASATLLASLAGDGALRVNGAAVVTTATFGAGLCEALTYRYVDQGDGTVRDCNTGRIWLKDASCLGTGTWGAAGTTGTVQWAVAQLNSGAQFNCSGYTAGTYTDWEVPAMTAMCGLWSVSCGGASCCSGSGCCTAGQGLVDAAFANPAVANAAGDGKWTAGDAFVGVQSGSVGYWSATATGAGGGNAWGVLLAGGQVVPGATSNSGRVWAVRGGP